MKAKPVILIVDDQPENIELLESYLLPQGYAIVKAASGEEALETLSAHPIDLILLDVLMPGMNGFEVARRVRLDNTYQLLPIIMLTALRETKDRVKGIEAGCDDFIPMPIDKTELLARVRSLLKVKAYNDLMSNYQKELESEVTRRTEELKHALENLQQDIAERKRAEERLRQTEELFRLIAENATDLIAVLDLEGKRIYSSPSYQSILGDPESLRGTDSFQEIHPEDQEKIRHIFLETVRTGIGQRAEYRFLLDDGSVRHIESQGSVIRDEDGNTNKVVVVSRDVTGRKGAEEALLASETKYRQLVARSPNGIFIADLSGRFLSVNSAMCENLGYAEDELLSMKIWEIVPQQYHSLHKQRLADIVNGASTNAAAEYEVKGKDGIVHCIEVLSVPYYKGKEIIGFQGIARDITERKRAEERLMESESRYRDLVESMQDGVYRSSHSGKFLQINSAMVKMLGYESKEDLMAIDIKSQLYFAENDRESAALEEKLQEMAVFRLRKKDGSLIWVEDHGRHVVDENGTVLYHEGILRDVSERKRVEATLAYERNLLRTLIDNIPDRIFAKDTEGRFIICNRSLAIRMGMLNPDEIVGKSDFDFLSQDLAAQFRADEQEIIRSGQSLINREEPMDSLSGETRWSLATKVPLRDNQGTVIGIVGMGRDITERRRAEETLKDSEERLRILFEYAPDAYYLNDLMGTFIDGNKAAEELTGYSRKELNGKSFLSLHLLQPKQLVKAGLLLAQNVLGRRTGPDEFTLKRKDGSEVTAEIRTFPVKIKEKTLVLGIARDITDRIQSESEVRKNRELLNSIFETSRDGIILEDEHGIIAFVNSAYVKLFRYESENELVGKHVSIVQAPEDNERLMEYGRERLGGGNAPSIYEFKGICKDGSLVDLEVSVAATEIGGKKHILSVVRDIRDRKKAESERQSLQERMRQAQKMESMGTLAGGIAHDFNNILGIILGHLSIVKRSANDESLRMASADTIAMAVQRGANLVRQILTFARKTEVSSVPVNVNESAKEIRKMLAQTFPKAIAFTMDLEKVLPLVFIDPDQLHQALLNLCVNARDAISEARKDADMQSTITLKTALVKGKELRARFPEVSAEQYVAIAVSDTGTGMDETTRKRIFEPFFTTKEKGKGTGLGLAVVYGVVRAAHGLVDVQSTPGRGSVFTLYIPVPREASPSERKHEKRHIEVPGGTETLLLIEDEESLLAILQMALEEKGYRTLTAVDGREALERFKQHLDRIDLVITDLGLPRIPGDVVLRRLKEMKPSIKIIVASGYTDPDQRSELLKSGANEIIMKPYDPSDVLERVRSVLDAR